MAILNKDEYINSVHARIGTDNSDESIKFLEDMVDTYEDLERKSTGDGEDWEKKYHELDETWKARYKHRFLTGSTISSDEADIDTVVAEEEKAETIEINDLFEKEE